MRCNRHGRGCRVPRTVQANSYDDALGVVIALDQVKRCAQAIAQHTYRPGEALSTAGTKQLCKKPL